MARKPLIDWTLHDGSTIRASDSFSKVLLAKMVALGYRPHAHMRMGRYAVTTYRTRISGERLLIARMYATTFNPQSDVAPKSKYWDMHVRDRSNQCSNVLKLIAGHPLAREVIDEIGLELAYFTKHAK